MLEINANMLLKKHKRFANIRSKLSENLKKEYEKRNARVIKGDTVKIMRGEYKNVEGKVEKVNTERSTLIIEGVQKEVAKGGKVKVHIHSSNVMITSLNTQDKKRENVIKKIKHTKLSSSDREGQSVSKDKSSKIRGRAMMQVKKGLRVKSLRKVNDKKPTAPEIEEDNNKGGGNQKER
jgi:large subunit ribosomal protein L24